jgi:predicted pyridoxine 5'-phosphate oxidase superfamily flavin-nucleotide-binding protein
MTIQSFADIAFTPTVKALQEDAGSRASYARMEGAGGNLGPREWAFLAERDSFYMASVSETGWPYVQHRGGPAGVLKVVDTNTIGFADFQGNKQYVSTGNLMNDDRVSLILVDYPNRQRLKLLGHVRFVDAESSAEDHAILDKLSLPDYRARVERGVLIDVAALDWNCPQHITPRYTVAEIEAVAKK